MIRNLLASPEWFQSSSIRRKLVTIIIAMIAIALLLSAVLVTLYNWQAERNQRMRQLETTADVISLQSATALEFFDTEAANETLTSLRTNSAITKACIYDETGALFASFTSGKPSTVCPPPLKRAHEAYRWNSLELAKQIQANGKTLGVIYLEYDLSASQIHLLEGILIQIGIMLSVLLLMLPLSSYLQSLISRPVIDLARITQNYSRQSRDIVYAEKKSDDEIGELVDAFNRMMKEIHENEQQLSIALKDAEHANKRRPKRPITPKANSSPI